MGTTFQLDAAARDGTQQAWSGELEHDAAAHEWTYRVTTPDCPDFYEARFREVGADHVQPDVLDRHHDAFRAQGLTEALFDRVVSDSGRTLISSANHGTKNFRNEFRSADAERVWRRLFAQELAAYDADADRFTFHPDGIPQGGGIRRAGARRRPQFYVKGSYVLDRVFGTDYANDVDVFWLDVGQRPTNARISRWMELCGFTPKPIQLARVTNLFACDGGGAPIFNFDLWRIEMDGDTYEMDPRTRVATKIRAAPATPLRFLPDHSPFALTPSVETNAVLDKALAKMARHPSLFDSATKAEILRLKERSIR